MEAVLCMSVFPMPHGFKNKYHYSGKLYVPMS